MIETAVALPVMLIIFGALVTFGQLQHAKLVCQHAAYAGAREAITQNSRAVAYYAANEKSKDIVEANAMNTDYLSPLLTQEPISSWDDDTYIKYTVRVDVKTLIPIIDTSFTPNSKTRIEESIIMKVEN